MWSACKDWTQSLWQQLERLADQAIPVGDFIVTQLPQQSKRIPLSNGFIATIRLATIEDIDAIAYVEEEAYMGNPPWMREAFAEDLTYNTKAIYIVLEIDDEIQAFIGARVTTKDLHITNIAVHSDVRFLGCATLLMKQLEKYARFLEKESISLEVRVSNKKAIRLYEKFGFVQTGYKEKYYKNEVEDAVLMTYPLPPKTPESFSSSEFSFKRLTVEDEVSEQLYQLVQQHYEHPGHWSAKAFQEDIASEHGAYYGVYHVDTLIGFVGMQVVLDEATITNIVIHTGFQGKGLAQRLWQMACYDLGLQEVATVFLEVREFNHRAQQLYEILGFECYHRRRDYYTDPLEDALLYRLELKKGACEQ